MEFADEGRKGECLEKVPLIARVEEDVGWWCLRDELLGYKSRT